MEIDGTSVPPPIEYSDYPSDYQSESSMNFDYLHGLNEIPRTGATRPTITEQIDDNNTIMDHSVSSSMGGAHPHHQQPTSTMFNNQAGNYYNSSPRHFQNVSASCSSTNSSLPSFGHVDDRMVDRPINLNERFVTVLDQLDARVEKYRKDALGLQEKRDFLLMSIDLIKSHDLLHNMTESEREEIICYIQRVNARLSTVELNVRTVRDRSQEDSLSQINAFIDMMITMGDPVLSRQRCQQYLNSCCSASETAVDMDAGPVDKKFESALLGCTLDDQKNIKKRLQALLDYLNKQTIRN